MRPPSPSIPEHDFTLEALRDGLRIDGRGILQMREVELEFGAELGWVECSLGKTRFVLVFYATKHVYLFSFVAFFCGCVFYSVLAYVEAKMVKPPPERPLEGVITIHSELSPMAAAEYESGR